MNREPKEFYVTLCQELQGYALKALAYDELSLTRHMNATYGGAWARITTERPPEQVQVIGKTVEVLNPYKYQ